MKQILYQYYIQIKILGSSINISVSEISCKLQLLGAALTQRGSFFRYILFRTRFQCLHSGYHLIARKQFMVIGITFVGFLSSTHRYQVHIYILVSTEEEKTFTNEYFSPLWPKILFSILFREKKIAQGQQDEARDIMKILIIFFMCGTDLQWDIGRLTIKSSSNPSQIHDHIYYIFLSLYN